MTTEHNQTAEKDYTAAQIMAAISAALKASDMEAAAALMPMLAVKDPTSAQMILDALDFLSLPDAATTTEGSDA